MHTFIVCAVFKNEAHILQEWIEHYLFHGADYLYLVNDFSTDKYQEIINKYPQVTLFHNDINTKEVGRQTLIANKFFLPLRETSEWMAILDLDEFLYSPYEISLPTVLEKYVAFSQIKVEWLHFGSNDHVLQPHVVTEGFTRRARLDRKKPYYSYKTIVRARDLVNINVHEHQVYGATYGMTYQEDAPSELIINHYSIQSEKFFMAVKATRGDINNWFDHEKLIRDKAFFDGYDINEVEDHRLADQNQPLAKQIKEAKLVGTNTVSLVITTCNRPAQLQKTLESFLLYNTYPIEKTFVIDDSGKRGCNKKVLDAFRAKLSIEEIYNTKNIGQVESIDKVYSYVRTPYIFHCEEDWEYLRPGFIEQSMAIFDANPSEKIFTIWLRAHNDSAHPVEQEGDNFRMKKDFSYMDDGQTYTWCGVTFNPGLRKATTCFLHHPYSYRCEPTVTKQQTYLGEYSVNTAYGKEGYYSRTLCDPRGHVRHIGWDVHIPRPWETQKTMLVSSYFKIPSKQSHSFYEVHLRRFFRAFSGRSLFFVCNKEIRTWILNLGTDLSKTVFHVCEFHELPILQKFPLEFWQRHVQLDAEKYHTPELGIIWNNKKECLQLAKENCTNATWFLWIDAGCIRDDGWLVSCSDFGSRQSLRPGIYLQTLHDIPKSQEFFQYDNVFIAGAILYAHTDFIDSLVSAYDAMILKYEAANISAISDQYILASLVNTESFLHTIPYASLKSVCIDKWFFFLQYI
jgi:glycosyltransferase involved in cell wall biosynthesis